MIYLYILRHGHSGLLWFGRATQNPEKTQVEVKHWKWKELLHEDTEVTLLVSKAFRDHEKAASKLREFRKEHRVKTSSRWVNSDCYLDKATSYVYLIQQKKTGQLYLGSQYGKRASPTNLGTRYFTSSDTVKQIGWGTFHTLEVRAVKNAHDYEAKLLKKEYTRLGRETFCKAFINRNVAPGYVLDADILARRAATHSARYHQKSAEEKAAIAEKRSKSIQAMSAEAKAARGAKISHSLLNKSDDEKAAIAAAANATKQGKTAEEKAETSARLSAARMRKSKAERALIGKRISESKLNRTEAEKEATRIKQSEAITAWHAARSEEQRELTSIRMSKAKQRRSN